jgi:Fe-S cluster biogenesis protein NfuA
VISEKEFQQKIRQLGTLVGELDQMPDGGPKVAARELVQLLMEVHGTGLERIMEIVFEAGSPGEAIIARFGHDPITRNLLLLYSLHPDDLETRVLKALDNVGPRLRKLDCEVKLVRIQDGAIQLQLLTSGHACGSTTSSLKSMVEESVYDYAPDLTSLAIVGPDDGPSSGFVPLQNLLQHSLAAHAPLLQAPEIRGGD